MGGVVSWIIFVAVVADPSARTLPVTGATACPVATDVEAALTGLIPARDPELPPDVAELKDDTGSVVVTLRRGSGDPIGEKRLDPGLSCAQRAHAAAVIVAAWEAHLATPATPLVVAPPPAPMVVAAAPPAMVLPVSENNVEVGVSAGGSVGVPAALPVYRQDLRLRFVRCSAKLDGSSELFDVTFDGDQLTGVGAGHNVRLTRDAI